MRNTFGIVSLILGLISIPITGVMAALISVNNLWLELFGAMVLASVIGWLVPFIAIIFGIVGFIKDESKGMAIAGLILGIVSLLIGILTYVIFMVIFYKIVQTMRSIL